MFDSIKILLQLIDTIVKNYNFMNWRKEKRLNAIGAKLYGIMVAANEVVITGSNILTSITSFVDNDRVKKCFDGELPWTRALDTGIHIQQKLVVHVYNLHRLEQAIEDARDEFQL